MAIIVTNLVGDLKKLYKCTSGIDAGTLFHLRNVIKDPAKKFTACEDFFDPCG